MGTNQSSENPNLTNYMTPQRGNNSVGCLYNGSTGLNQSNNMYPHMTPKSDFNLVNPYGRMNPAPFYGGFSQSFPEHMPPKSDFNLVNPYGRMNPAPFYGGFSQSFPEHMPPKSDFNLVNPYGRMNPAPFYGGFSQSFPEHMPPKPLPCLPTHERLWSRDAYGNMQQTPNQLTPYQGVK